MIPTSKLAFFLEEHSLVTFLSPSVFCLLLIIPDKYKSKSTVGKVPVIRAHRTSRVRLVLLEASQP